MRCSVSAEQDDSSDISDSHGPGPHSTAFWNECRSHRAGAIALQDEFAIDL
jgi:hypothetical protein